MVSYCLKRKKNAENINPFAMVNNYIIKVCSMW